MARTKKPFRTLPELQFQPTHFTMEECERVVAEIFAEKRKRAEGRNRAGHAAPGTEDVKAP
jgi:hypothetical protein